jgi:hypothetical protein
MMLQLLERATSQQDLMITDRFAMSEMIGRDCFVGSSQCPAALEAYDASKSMPLDVVSTNSTLLFELSLYTGHMVSFQCGTKMRLSGWPRLV